MNAQIKENITRLDLFSMPYFWICLFIYTASANLQEKYTRIMHILL